MTPNERPTPLTDASEQRMDDIPTKNALSYFVPADFARALEAKLAKCREALKAVVENPPCTQADCCESAISCEGARKLAIITLEETK